jgi:uncharacterized phage protein (TIGR02218 family)
MAKTVSIALASHYAQGSNTISRQWKATRRDGFVLAVTTCARDLLLEGVLYRSADGFVPKAIEQEASTAVANTEVEGALSDLITEIEFESGLWDGCTVEVFEVNYRDLSMGKMSMGVRTMGDIRVTRSAFNAELRGLAQSMQKIVGLTYLATCNWTFGDPDTCRIDLAPLTVTGAFTAVTDRRTLTDSARVEASDYWGAGVLTITSGDAEGESIEVYSFASGQFVTHLPFKRNVAVGDTYSVTPGCRKRFLEDCKTKWSNGVNNGGYPYLPGPDKIIGLGGTEGSNL